MKIMNNKNCVLNPNRVTGFTDTEWIAGFFSGEGCFFVNICKAMIVKLVIP